jgi:predicted DNA-binding transcriptional regulator YafY
VLQTAARLLRLLTLLQSRREWSGSQLAERLEVTERTVRRDMDRLRALGYPVHSTSGLAGGYRLRAGAELPPLLLEDDEALAVAIGLRSAATGTVSGIEEAAVRALTKLEQVLPPRLRRRIKALHEHIVPLQGAGPRVDASVLSALAAACRDHERAMFQYVGQSGATQRNVEPHGLVHSAHRWYLVAWDVERDAFRTFRVDRIAGAVVTGVPFAPRPLPDRNLAAYVSRAISTTVYESQAKVILHAPIERVAERVSPAAGVLESIDEQRCLLQTGAHSLDHLAVYIALLGVEFEVKEPPELRDHIAALARRLRRAASRTD